MKKASSRQLKIDAEHLLKDKKQEKLQAELIKFSHVPVTSGESHRFPAGQEKFHVGMRQPQPV